MEQNTSLKSKNKVLTIKELVIFSLLGAMMFTSKLITEAFPNIHLLGMFIVAFTAVYRKKALYPIYLFVFLSGIFYGFPTWWLPYLYIWTVLWAMVMLIPQNLSDNKKSILYIAVCSLHGLLYGTLYAPAQAILFGLSFNKMIAWIITGFPFDLIHAVSNALCGFLIIPIIKVLKRA